MHKIMAIELNVEGMNFVNPSALLAKEFASVPKITARSKLKYGSIDFAI